MGSRREANVKPFRLVSGEGMSGIEWSVEEGLHGGIETNNHGDVGPL
jgi:hypothetical protein